MHRLPATHTPRDARWRGSLLVVFSSLLLGFAWLPAFAAENPDPRLLRVRGDRVTAARLSQLGFDVLPAPRHDAILVLEWPGDAERLAALGIATQVEDATPGATLGHRTRADFARLKRPADKLVMSAARSDGQYRLEAAPAFGFGGLGGFYKLAEIKMKLDDWVASDPGNVIADKVDTVGTTVMGRPIWGLAIHSAWPGPGPDPRPVTLLSALTHAREPEGMQAIVRFVDDLIARYPTDAHVQYLLAHRRLYVCPVVNPDGYKYNEDRWVATGSFNFWRKNQRDNNNSGTFNTSTDGVDLNRNYPYKWGLNNLGSSGSQSSDTYRGPSAGSEPETQAQMNLVISKQVLTGMSFHTYSDLHIHPWGWTLNATPDSLLFQRWTDDMTIANGYTGGLAPRFLYEVNGEFNDWCYGEVVAKPKGFTWTPEVGSPEDGFWPLPSRITPLADENLRMCYYVLGIGGPYLQIDSHTVEGGFLPAGFSKRLLVQATNVGLASSGSAVTGTLSSLTAGANVLQPVMDIGIVASLAATPPGIPSTDWFQVSVDDTVTPGRALQFAIAFSTSDGVLSRDTLTIVSGVPTILFASPGEDGLGSWIANGWGLETGPPGTYFSDSPNSSHPSNMDFRLRTRFPFDLRNGLHAWVRHRSKWVYESRWDGGLIEASSDSINWIALPSTAAVPSRGVTGAAIPAAGPVIQGSRTLWADDWTDLSLYAGKSYSERVWVRFRSVSDGNTNNDGLNLDNIEVYLYDPAAQPGPTAVGDSRAGTLELAAPAPNPAAARVSLAFTLPQATRVRLEIIDLQGRRVRELANGHYDANRWVYGWDLRDEASQRVRAGIYFARLVTDSGVRTQRFAVIH
ncbi:MAG: T9SS type A sorting domain-containing protein [Candidatus Eisenbacteria bacterium]|uniref:T9SS type A sorting domain-containing protein n=1 Tax=Eiseniibacteriota bacterium TaxID=2212470 RepID=A0A849SRN1_UNCEI|nr:T9SS type A sorting domain-containing protein [Candidatus Eisenbacteria bacterium]